MFDPVRPTLFSWMNCLINDLFNHINEALTFLEALSYSTILMVFREVLGDRLQYFTSPSTIH